MKAWIGIDVSKEWLDACFLGDSGKPKHKQFRNEQAGFAKLLRWTHSFGSCEPHLCMESTGRYSHALAEWLVEAGQTVSVENPARIRHHGLSEGMLNKTDRADARVIASYAREKKPAPWRMSAPEVRQLTGMMRRIQNLTEHLTSEKNRLKEPSQAQQVKDSLKETIAFLEAQIASLRSQIDAHIRAHPKLKEDKQLLESIPGIGETTALWLMAELPDVRQFEDAQAAAAFAGLAPCRHESGKTIKKKTRLSKAGSIRLRAALYFPAITAATHNPIVRDLYQRLIDRDMCAMAAIGACMRKLVMIAYGVLKNRSKFRLQADPQSVPEPA